MLHVANGEAAAQRIRAAQLPGEVAVWRDMLSEGPCPNGLAAPEDWSLRARVLERTYGIAARAYLDAAAGDRQLVQRMQEEEHVVLWSDEDLFCQVNLAYVLAQAADDWVGAADLRLASEGRESAHTPDDARVAFERRTVLGPRQAASAVAFWEHYGSDDPEPLAELLARGFPSWRWLAQGLPRHMDRFPRDEGLSIPEEAVLHTLHDGALAFPQLWKQVQMRPDVRGLGLGDAQVAALLRDLARPPAPLVLIDGPPGEPARWSVRLGADANRVLGGEDAVELRGIDRWLGGLHLEGKGPVWRWDGLSLRHR